MVTAAMSRGPAIGVLAMMSSAAAMAQHATGAAPRSSKIRHRRGAVPLRRATWMVASAIPAPNQSAYIGSQNEVGSALMNVNAVHSSQIALAAAVTSTMMMSVRTGCHRRPTATITMSGSSR